MIVGVCVSESDVLGDYCIVAVWFSCGTDWFRRDALWSFRLHIFQA